MREIEKLDDGLSDMQHGFRKGRNTYHSAMSIITAIDIFRQARTGFALVETDCKAAFDCCIPEIVKMSWLAKGVPAPVAEFIYNHQTQTKYDVTAGGLVSSRTYGGEDSTFGNGQGGGISADCFTVSQDITNRALEQCPVKACTIRDPISGEVKTNNGSLFADDLSISAGSNITNNSPLTNLRNLQHVTQLANDCHRASGGSFSIPKCSFRLVAITKRGQVRDHPATFSITPTPTSQPEHFNQKPLEEAHRTLGIHITPDLKPHQQTQLLLQKSIQARTNMRMNPLHPDASFCAYQQHLLLAFIYPLVAQRLTIKAINKIQSPIIIQLLHRLNLSSTMSRRLIHLPSRFGGAGIPNWAATFLAHDDAP